MITLHIEHAISDFGEWMQAFERFADVRHNSGVLRHRVHRPADDPRYVLIDLDFTTSDEAIQFLDFLNTRVWSTPANAPALIGAPRTTILDLIEQS